jgi:hypothetical protein
MTIRSAVRVAATIVSVSTFVLLYAGLVDLARIAGMADFRSWLYPLAIDGMVAAAYAATLVLRRGHLAFAWFVVVVGSFLSLVGQWLHAERTSDWTFAGPIAAAPALCMALVWHLLFLVVTRHEEAPEEAPVAEVAETVEEDTTDDEFAAIVRAIEPPMSASASAPVAERATTTTRSSADTLEKVALAVGVLREARDRGEDINGADMARLLHLPNAGTPSGRRTGLRYLRRAEDALQP